MPKVISEWFRKRWNNTPRKERKRELGTIFLQPTYQYPMHWISELYKYYRFSLSVNVSIFDWSFVRHFSRRTISKSVADQVTLAGSVSLKPDSVLHCANRRKDFWIGGSVTPFTGQHAIKRKANIIAFRVPIVQNGTFRALGGFPRDSTVSDLRRFLQIPTVDELIDYLAEKTGNGFRKQRKCSCVQWDS
jgi:hypothetical protein